MIKNTYLPDPCTALLSSLTIQGCVQHAINKTYSTYADTSPYDARSEAGKQHHQSVLLCQLQPSKRCCCQLPCLAQAGTTSLGTPVDSLKVTWQTRRELLAPSCCVMHLQRPELRLSTGLPHPTAAHCCLLAQSGATATQKPANVDCVTPRRARAHAELRLSTGLPLPTAAHRCLLARSGATALHVPANSCQRNIANFRQ
jgi:hypothetical protein